MDGKQLVELAFQARESSYSPYSGFAVGAALLCASGKVYLGCNVENASYGAGICAERTAAVKAISEGERRFAAVAVVGFPAGKQPEDAGFAWPCGICRQFLREFAAPGMKVYVAKGDEIRESTLEDLLPNSFGPEDLAF
ncbi:cytidine deaminase [Ruminococcaceae bacterium OttesenSCG-928-D13]|nr:cytidine deaminase [Ruminococcaceae bacterium OttesenSCG-928-D13]